MHPADITALAAALAQLISVLVWPCLLVYVLVRFSPQITDFLANLSAISLRGGGFEVTATSRNQAAASLAAAAVAWPSQDGTPHATANAARQAVRTVGDLSRSAIRRFADATILWVDDEPNNNINERQSLEALGVRFILSTSTENALAEVAARSFDVIVSDMARGDDQRAGYTLLDTLRRAGTSTPFIVYASSRRPDHVAEAKAHGAFGCTNRATELFDLVLAALA